jgi:hypothetical protein
MKLLSGILLYFHIACVVAIVVLLLNQAGKAIKKVPKGFIHAGIGALIAGLAMIGTRSVMHRDNPDTYASYNNGTLTVKLLVLIAILYLGFKHSKEEAISRTTWASLLGLTVINIGLASSLSR